MTTTTLHGQVRRGRFTDHLTTALKALLPAGLRRRDTANAGDPAREAAAVRELAYRYVKTDPGFADDLYAAANRHETLYTR